MSCPLMAVLRKALKASTWLVLEHRHRRMGSEDLERGDRLQRMPLVCVTAQGQ